MEDPFPDKKQLHRCLHTTTRNYVKVLYEEDLLWEHTCTSLRNAIEKGLSLPPGYLDTPMYRTIIRRNAVSVRDQLRLQDERNRALSATASAVVSFGHSNGPLNTDLYYLIAAYLPKPSLHALSLTCREISPIAQRELFRDVQIFCRGPEGKKRLEKVIAFLAGNRRIANYVNRLSAQTCDLEDEAELTAAEVQDIITALPKLTHLTLICFQWVHDSKFVPSTTKHNRLKHLALHGIRVKDVLGSPIEILRLAKTWSSLMAEYITHPDISLALGYEPVSVPHLSVYHFPWFERVSTIPDSCDMVCDTVTLKCDHVIDNRCKGLANILKLSTNTLKWIRFAISPFDNRLTPVTAWQEFFESLSRCINLEKLTFQIGVRPDNRIVEGNETDEARLHWEAAFLSALISAASNSIICLDIVLDLRGAHGHLAHKKFGLVHWDTIGHAIRSTSRLQYVGIRYKGFVGGIDSWPERHIAKVQDIVLHNDQLMDTLNHRRHNQLIAYHHEQGLNAARRMLRETYGAR